MARILETAATAKLKRNSNGSLSFYKNNKHYVHTLWIIEIEQPHQINGTRKQSAHVAHWYPRSYAPGDLQVTIRCRTQTDYQRLANLVRMHQKLLTETPGLRFSGRANSIGLRHMMLLRIPSENITVRGWIPEFRISKKGVFEPAPQYTFGFFTAIDPYSSNPIISHQIREWWNPKKMKPTPSDVKFQEDPDEGRPTRNIPEIQAGL